MKNFLSSLLLTGAIVFGSVLFLSAPVLAQEGGAADEAEGTIGSCQPGAGGGFLNMPTWYKYLPGTTEFGKCTPVIDIEHRPSDVAKIALAVLEIILRVAGIVAVIFVIWGGFIYLLSQGDAEKVKGARETIVHALVGMAIAVSATAIVNLLARSIT